MFREYHCVTFDNGYYDVVRSIVACYAEGDYFWFHHKKGEYRTSVLAKFKERRWNNLLHDLMLLDEWHEDLELVVNY